MIIFVISASQSNISVRTYMIPVDGTILCLMPDSSLLSTRNHIPFMRNRRKVCASVDKSMASVLKYGFFVVRDSISSSIKRVFNLFTYVSIF